MAVDELAGALGTGEDEGGGLVDEPFAGLRASFSWYGGPAEELLVPAPTGAVLDAGGAPLHFVELLLLPAPALPTCVPALLPAGAGLMRFPFWMSPGTLIVARRLAGT